MSIVNKRNAVLGWVTWETGKWLAREKTKKARPSVEGGRPNKPALTVAGLAALGGVVLFWRKRKSGGGEGEAAA